MRKVDNHIVLMPPVIEDAEEIDRDDFECEKYHEEKDNKA